MALRPLQPAPHPRAAGWLVPGLEYRTPGADVTWLEYLIVRRVLRDEGILEQPIGSNRGGRIDAMTKRSGAPLGSYWCGIEVGAVFADCGALVPAEYPAVRAWYDLMTDTPRPGSAIVYRNAHGQHIEIVTRTRTGLGPYGGLLTCGGNRGYAGSGTNNGVGVDQAPMTRRDVVGFVRPTPVPDWTLATYAPADFLLEHWPLLPKPERAAALAKIRATLGLVELAT